MSERKISGAIITIAEAKNLVQAFKSEYPNSITAHVIDVALLRQLIDQTGCAQVRIYNGYNAIENKISPVLIGVDEDDIDMMGIILDRTRPCPPFSCSSELMETSI